MKTFYTALLAVLCIATTLQLNAQCTSCTYNTNDASIKYYVLFPGQTLCITKKFKGTILNFPAGATICVAPGVSFEPADILNAKGTINVYGTFKKTSFTAENGFILNNYGFVDVTNFDGHGAVTINNQGTAEITRITVDAGSTITSSGTLATTDLIANGATNFINSGTATITHITLPGGSTMQNSSSLQATSIAFNGAVNFDNSGSVSTTSFSTASGSTFTNAGPFTATSISLNGANTVTNYKNGSITTTSISTLAANTVFKNYGNINISSNLNVGSGSTFQNFETGKVYVGSSFTADGTVVNKGYTEVSSSVTINSGSAFSNYCGFVAKGMVTNNSSNLQNFSFFILSGSNKQLTNNGKFYNAPQGFVQGDDFLNDGTVTGGGNFRFTGTTKNQGSFGMDNDNLTINFYDASLKPGKLFMDTENNQFGAVTKNAVAEKPLAGLENNCTSSSAIILPIKLMQFTGALAGEKALLNWQVADNETGNYFELQKSTNGVNYSLVAMLFVSEKTGVENYRYTDAANAASKTYYRLKIVNKDQSVNYSNVVYFDARQKAATILSLLQNPVQNTLSFNYQATQNTLAEVSVYTSSGVKIMSQKHNMQKGNNSISLPLAVSLGKGLYLLEVKENNSKQTIRFVKQ